MAPLTRKEKRLRGEVEDIASAICMDVWNVEEYDPESREARLQVMKDHLVRGEVIGLYTLIDEFLTNIICDFYFRRRKKGTSYRRLWKTKRFRIFVHHIMDETSLLKKLTIVDAIEAVPNEVRNAITRINTVRNALAHSFFPENRRRYAADKKVIYNGVPLFTREGVEKLGEDFHLARRHLVQKIFGTDVNDLLDQV